MNKQKDNQHAYDGAEMDEVTSPPLIMIGTFALITIIGFGYAYLWEFLLTK